jgi:hypothetical protein
MAARAITVDLPVADLLVAAAAVAVDLAAGVLAADSDLVASVAAVVVLREWAAL